MTLGKLSQLELVAKELKEGKSGSDTLQRLDELINYFSKEVRMHFRQEEMVLFPVMEKLIGRAGFIHAMLDEHQSFWRAFETLEERREAVSGSLKVKPSEVRPLEEVLTHIVAFLKSHINKEEKSFFPLAEKSLDLLAVRETEQLLERLKSVHS